MRELNIVKPFSIGPYSFKDLRSVSESVASRARSIQYQALQDYPHDLFCAGSTARLADREALLRARTPQQKRAVRDRIKELNKPGVRKTLSDYLGDISPVTFVVRRNGKIFGTWQIFSLRILQETSSVLRVSAGWFPAFPRTASPRQTVRLGLIFALDLLDTHPDLVGGQKLNIARWVFPSVTDVDRGADLELMKEVFLEMPNHPEFSMQKRSVPGQDGRESITLTRSAAPKQNREDPFDNAGE